MTELLTSYIDGAWLTDWSGATNELTNPATEQVTDCVALAGPAEVDAAVAAARRSFATYSKTTAAERIEILQRISAQLKARAEDLAAAVTLDMGMPLANSRIAVGAAQLQFEAMIELLGSYPFTSERDGISCRRTPLASSP